MGRGFHRDPTDAHFTSVSVGISRSDDRRHEHKVIGVDISLIDKDGARQSVFRLRNLTRPIGTFNVIKSGRVVSRGIDDKAIANYGHEVERNKFNHACYAFNSSLLMVIVYSWRRHRPGNTSAPKGK